LSSSRVSVAGARTSCCARTTTRIAGPFEPCAAAPGLRRRVRSRRNSCRRSDTTSASSLQRAT
jgi:hypothetical protein